ncbi:efflux RND transporter periplasmic adaptor subunit [Roseibium sp.]|uniref:efflux RND transporter periplasmic adaptor subunit n=1 Tax=Roseibium sp. TaxID=1936156 RepID=UPI003A96AF77
MLPRLHAALIVLASVLAPSIAIGDEFAVKVEEVADWRPVFGSVDSVKRAFARARLSGDLVTLEVSEGDAVQAGQEIARIVDDKLALEIAALDASIRALRAQAAQAQLDLDRAEELRARGAISAAVLDQAQTARNVIEGNQAAREAERSVLIARQAEGIVRAPDAGRVLSVPVVQGMFVNPGENIAEIATDEFVLRAHLPERHARYLGVGQTVRIEERGVLSGGGATHEGKITKVYPELVAGQVVVDIAATELGDYFVGERVRLQVATGQRPAIVVPAGYLRLRHGVTFARLEGSEEVVVQPGVPVDDGVEVLAGLKPGDRLVSYEEKAK